MFCAFSCNVVYIKCYEYVNCQLFPLSWGWEDGRISSWSPWLVPFDKVILLFARIPAPQTHLHPWWSCVICKLNDDSIFMDGDSEGSAWTCDVSNKKDIPLCSILKRGSNFTKGKDPYVFYSLYFAEAVLTSYINICLGFILTKLCLDISLNFLWNFFLRMKVTSQPKVYEPIGLSDQIILLLWWCKRKLFQCIIFHKYIVKGIV